MNRQDTARTEGNNGLMDRWLASGGAFEAPARIDAAADDDMRAGGWSGHPVFCADDGLRAGRVTTHPFACTDEELRAGRMTTHPFACADDGLRCGNITQGYGCIPPQADDGLKCGNATGPMCYGAIG